MNIPVQDLVSPLASILDTPLTVIIKANAKDAKKMTRQIVTKGSVGYVPFSDGENLTLLNAVKASFVADPIDGIGAGAGVLMRVLGDLYLYAVYSYEQDYLTVYVLDADKLPMTPQTIAKVNMKTPERAVKVLLPAVVARYETTYTSDIWIEGKIDASIVGFRRDHNNEQCDERVTEV